MPTNEPSTSSRNSSESERSSANTNDDLGTAAPDQRSPQEGGPSEQAPGSENQPKEASLDTSDEEQRTDEDRGVTGEPSESANEMIELGFEIMRSAGEPSTNLSPDTGEFPSNSQESSSSSIESDPFLPDLVEPQIDNKEVFFDVEEGQRGDINTPEEALESELATPQPDNTSFPASPPDNQTSEPNLNEVLREDSGVKGSVQDSNSGTWDVLRDAIFDAGQAIVLAGERIDGMDNSYPDSDYKSIETAQTSLSEAQIAIILARASLDELSQEDIDALGEGETSKVEELLNRAEDLVAKAARQLGQSPTGSSEQALDDSVIGVSSRGRNFPSQRISELDEELTASISIFENEMQAARDSAAAALSGREMQPVWETSVGRSDIDGRAAGERSSENQGELSGGSSDYETEDNTASTQDISEGQEILTGRTPDGRRFESPPPPEDLDIPEDIPSPQGDDIVAKQLREAAMAEQDPELREKLWEEYKRYKAGL